MYIFIHLNCTRDLLSPKPLWPFWKDLFIIHHSIPCANTAYDVGKTFHYVRTLFPQHFAVFSCIPCTLVIRIIRKSITRSVPKATSKWPPGGQMFGQIEINTKYIRRYSGGRFISEQFSRIYTIRTVYSTRAHRPFKSYHNCAYTNLKMLHDQIPWYIVKHMTWKMTTTVGSSYVHRWFFGGSVALGQEYFIKWYKGKFFTIVQQDTKRLI